MGINVYQLVTDRIISQLKQGKVPWQKPWCGVAGGAFNRITQRPYSLLNQMLLRKVGEYATFRQWTDLGGKIKKGEKAEMVVFWKLCSVKERDDEDEIPDDEEERMFPVLRYYNVFHISQVENVEPLQKEEIRAVEPICEAQRILTSYIDREDVELVHRKGNKASYSPTFDLITMPLMEQFVNAPEYYSTVFHECVHSTGHSDRCNRLLKCNPFSKEYAKEELVAEIGAAFLLNHAGITNPATEKNNAAYLRSWLKELENDNKFIISAAGKAEKAVKYMIHGKMEEAADDQAA